jgi:hypothetical protein
MRINRAAAKIILRKKEDVNMDRKLLNTGTGVKN